MDLLHKQVEQSQVTSPNFNIHDVVDNEVRELRSEPCLGVIEEGNCDMVVEFGLESVIEVVENQGNTDMDVDDDDFFVERRDLGHETESDIRLIRVESGSDDDGIESETELWGIDLNEGVYVDDEDGVGVESEREIWGVDLNEDVDDEDDVSVTIPLCWDSLQSEGSGVTSDEFDWEEVDDDDETEIRIGFAQVDINEESSDSEELSTRETSEGSGNRGWEVLLNSHTLEINIDMDTRELFTIDDHEDYIQTTEFEMLVEQFADTEIPILSLPPTCKHFLKNLPMILLKGENNDDDDVVCAICKDKMDIGNEAVQLPCNHKYHGECIVPWLEVRNTCPVCRFELPTDDAEYEQRKIQRTTSTYAMVL